MQHRRFGPLSPSFHVACLALLAAGCAAPPVIRHTGTEHDGRLWSDLRENVVTFDRDGCPRDPANPDAPAWSAAAFDAHVTRLLAAMDAYHAARPAGAPRRVLIFVHGGLNDSADSITAADGEIDQIKDDAATGGYFPIFVNWNSGLTDSYGEHLMTVTQGCKQYENPWLRAALSPLYLFADLGRAVTRAPIVWAHQIGTDLAAVRADGEALRHSADVRNAWIHSIPDDHNREVFLELNGAYLADEWARAAADDPGAGPAPAGEPGFRRRAIRVSIGEDHPDQGQLFGLSAAYVVTSPVKYGLSWILDGLGKPAWDNMSRRTLMLFDGLSGGDVQYATAAARDRHHGRGTAGPRREFVDVGALQTFADRLAQKLAAAAPDAYDLTLVGHSMGSMVLNEWVRRNPDMPYTRIVYMAAACTVRSFAASVVPYLRTHPKTEFFNLTLHPTSDMRERRRFDDLPPRGSLLVWVDDFLSDPQTPFDRTLGRWQSLSLVDRVLPDAVRGQVTFKAFGRSIADDKDDHRDADPQNHGGFRGKAYWVPAFWAAAPPRGEADPLVNEAVREGAAAK